MKKKLEKFMYMGLGALIALGGYFFGTLHSDNVDAQQAPADVEYNNIRCRNLTIVDDTGKTLLTLSDSEFGGWMSVRSKSGKSRATVGIGAEEGVIISASRGFDVDNPGNYTGAGLFVDPTRGSKGARVEIQGDSKVGIMLGTDDYGGRMIILNKSGENVLQTSVNNAGGGFIGTWDQFGDATGGFPKGKSLIQKFVGSKNK